MESRARQIASRASFSPANMNEQLDKLAEEIRAELNVIEGRNMVAHAIAAGERLIEAKGLVKSGQWISWVAENFPGARSSSKTYMQMARHQNEIASALSIRDALRILRPPSRPKAQTNGGTEPKKLRSKEGARRKRETAEERRKAERARQLALADLLKMQGRLAEIVRVLETTDFNAEFELDDIAVDALMQTADDLVTTIEWCDRALGPVRARLGVSKVMELIRKLENTDGRSPQEAEMFRRRAELLRRKHGLELAA